MAPLTVESNGVASEPEPPLKLEEVASAKPSL